MSVSSLHANAHMCIVTPSHTCTDELSYMYIYTQTHIYTENNFKICMEINSSLKEIFTRQ